MIGIITYHSAYNFGSALQAFATQYSIEKFGCTVEIINYRMVEQRKFYSLYRTSYGIKTAVKDLQQLPIHKKRRIRQVHFEYFFKEYMHLSEEFSKPEQIMQFWNKYDVIISGSDQIWNKHSCELENNDWKYMKPYLLDGYFGRKVSYASSVANMNDDELERIIPSIRIFSAVSMREKVSAEKMSLLLRREVPYVLDPTFLLMKEDWIAALKLKKYDREPYILYYSLGGAKAVLRHWWYLKQMAKKTGRKVMVVTPFFYRPCYGGTLENHPEYGPKEFLEALYNADTIVTDSYHGTILSVNFGKDVYSLCKHGGSQFRKTDILERLGLEDRIIYDMADILKKEYAPIDYATVYERLLVMRNDSLSYLGTSVSEQE